MFILGDCPRSAMPPTRLHCVMKKLLRPFFRLLQRGLGVAGNIYVGSGSKVGFVNASNVSVVYQVYNATAGSLDTVFG